jgi:hypothetical protein
MIRAQSHVVITCSNHIPTAPHGIALPLVAGTKQRQNGTTADQDFEVVRWLQNLQAAKARAEAKRNHSRPRFRGCEVVAKLAGRESKRFHVTRKDKQEFRALQPERAAGK